MKRSLFDSAATEVHDTPEADPLLGGSAAAQFALWESKMKQKSQPIEIGEDDQGPTFVFPLALACFQQEASLPDEDGSMPELVRAVRGGLLGEQFCNDAQADAGIFLQALLQRMSLDEQEASGAEAGTA